MMPNDPIMVWATGAVAAAGGWFIRRLDQRVSKLESDMAEHTANKEMLDRMYTELQELTKLTSRIAGHLNLS